MKIYSIILVMFLAIPCAHSETSHAESEGATSTTQNDQSLLPLTAEEEKKETEQIDRIESILTETKDGNITLKASQIKQMEDRILSRQKKLGARLKDLEPILESDPLVKDFKKNEEMLKFLASLKTPKKQTPTEELANSDQNPDANSTQDVTNQEQTTEMATKMPTVAFSQFASMFGGLESRPQNPKALPPRIPETDFISDSRSNSIQQIGQTQPDSYQTFSKPVFNTGSNNGALNLEKPSTFDNDFFSPRRTVSVDEGKIGTSNRPIAPDTPKQSEVPELNTDFYLDEYLPIKSELTLRPSVPLEPPKTDLKESLPSLELNAVGALDEKKPDKYRFSMGYNAPADVTELAKLPEINNSARPSSLDDLESNNTTDLGKLFSKLKNF